MKSLLFLVTLAAVLTSASDAQNLSHPTLSLSNHGDSTANEDFGWGPPPPAPNILFYGGDVNADDPNVYAFANGNTLLVPDSPTYGAVRVPKTGHFVITGIFFNGLALGTGGNVFDPPTGTYDIRVDMNSYGGKSVASGSGVQTAQPTGRMPFGYTEYTTSVALTEPFTPTNGETYWVNESPQCTDSGNPACENGQFYVDNTTQRTGAVNGGAQPKGESFFDCNFCSGLTFYNTCETGANAQQCAYLSFGIYGHGK